MEKFGTTDVEKLEVNIFILEKVTANKKNVSNVMDTPTNAMKWLINELSKYNINLLKDKLF